MSLTDAVRAELLAHPGVTESAHRFGGVVFHLNGHEIGHLHGETTADLPFAPHIRDELVAGGRVSGDGGHGDSRWVSRTVEGPADVAQIVALFRLSLEHVASLPPRVQEQPAPERPPGSWWRSLLRRSRR